MAWKTKGLTAKRVERLREPGRYHDAHGLCLQVGPTGTKSWLLRYERHGKERWMGLGPVWAVSLKQARERAREAKLKLLEGTDPIEARKAANAASALKAAKQITFEQAAMQFYELHHMQWRNAKSNAQFLSSLRAYAFPHIGKLAVADIDVGLVLKCIEPIWHSKTETASRVRGRIESVLDWCTVRGYRSGDNPAKWRGNLKAALPEPSKVKTPRHFPALPFSRLPAFMEALARRDGIAARALEFCILTASRTGEVIGATWPEIDFEERVWTVPAVRMKGHKQHRVPLSDRVIELLQALPREEGNDFVFIGPRGGGLSNMGMASVLRRMNASVTVHGMRSCFSDWCHEMTSFPSHVIEKSLSHSIKNKAEAAYRRGDLLEKRRELMDAWASYCVPPTGENVVPIREAAR